MDGVKGGPKEKRLAAQFIPKFFKHFPELADSAINAQLDLCEDEDVSVSAFFFTKGKMLLECALIQYLKIALIFYVPILPILYV